MKDAWRVDPIADVLVEAARYASMTPNERGALVASACRGAAATLAARPDAERALAWRDPIPESSKRVLARLRAEWRAKRDAAA
ncbi:MAG: hypothetical protein JJ863_12320 [Deltaproteobacteria bacterium]|nr:hypothetical protein [Deltaproteobacteria bacterium]